MERGVPKTALEGRLWNFANKGEEFWPIREWPPHMKEYFLLGQERNNAQRYELYAFWTMNGMAPEVASEWIRLADAANGVKVFTQRKKVLEHCAEMERQVAMGTLVKGKRLLDMIERRVQPVWQKQRNE